MRVGPMGPGPVSSSLIPSLRASAFRSKPAEKWPPAPVSTATANASSAAKRSKESTSCPAVSGSTALRTSGRSMVTTTTWPSGSYRTVMDGGLLRIHVRIAVILGRGVGLFDRARAGPADEVEDRAGLVVGAGGAPPSKRL